MASVLLTGVPTLHAHPPTGRTAAHGYAMVVSLLMTSFLVVLVLGLTAFVRVETVSSATDKYRLEARENARMAMMIALGELQRHAGPDRRSTARAEILGAGEFLPETRFWTGVWNNEEPLSEPVWLVSGGGTPREAPADAIEIFPAVISAGADGTYAAPVVAALETASDFDDGQVKEQGRFAWWVSGEASKANIVAGRGTAEENGDGVDRYPAETRGFFEYQVPFGPDLSAFFPEIVLDASIEEPARAANARDLLFLTDDTGSPMADTQALERYTHDLTVQSFGVLENAAGGGLKRNLSDRETPPDDLLAGESFYDLLDRDYSRGMEVENGFIPGSADGRPYLTPRPIPTEIVLYVGLFHTRSDARVRVRYHVQAEFLNPYSVPLRFPRDRSSGYDRGMIFYFQNLPRITVTELGRSPVAPTLVDELDNLVKPYGSGGRDTINSWFEIAAEFRNPDVPMLEPGEVYRVMEPDTRQQARGLSREFGDQLWADDNGTRPGPSARIKISAEHPERGVRIYAVPYSDSPSAYRQRPIFDIRNLKFDDFEITKVFDGGPNPFSRSTSSSYTRRDYLFAYHFRLYSDDSDLDSLRDVLVAADLREPVFDAEDTYIDEFGEQRVKAELLDPLTSDPSFIIQDDSNLFSNLDVFTDRTERSHNNDYRKLVLYDLPTGEPLSVGALASSLMFPGSPALALGSPRGGDLNEAFDRYYLSPKADRDDSGRLPHPRFAPLAADAATGYDDAAGELAEGPFNVNSLSVAAWQSLLGAPALTEPAADERVGGTRYRPAAFFRHAFFESERLAANGGGFDGGRFIADRESLVETIPSVEDFALFSQGIRVVGGTGEGNPEIESLARQVVRLVGERVREQGGPFASLSEFVNSGLLQQAIDAVGTEADTAGLAAQPINAGLHAYSNVYLTGNDIAAKLAPTATVRSDTFTIRAYGDAVNPTSGERVSEAYCEAVVQRVPQPVEAGRDPLLFADDESGGRRFKVLSFRWIDKNDAI